MTTPTKGLTNKLLTTLLFTFAIAGCGSDSSSTDNEYSEDEQSVGLFLNSSDALNGYTLFGTLKYNTTYLIDNCGELVQSWESDYSSMSVYLLENGNLLHAARLESAVNDEFLEAGGDSGRVEIFNPDGELEWYYEVNNDSEFMHHDIEYIESTGTVLVMIWVKHSAAEAKAAGFSGNYALWSEKIVELDPTADSAEEAVIWQWNSWDHMVQNYDASQDNYAESIADNPQLININHIGDDVEYSADPIHLNGVDYNAELDQILLTSRNFNEFWIIDHSTTTAEAASHSGGDQGKGGDILYRWGNPMAYDMGDEDDQKLFLQHDANWIDEGYNDAGKIMVFNNQAGYYDGIDYSTVDIIDTGVNSDGSYSISSDGTYAPDSFSWSYQDDEKTDFYAANISNARQLSNGNTIITEGTTGRIFEVTDLGEKVWEYVNPVGESGPVEQGETPSKNYVFRAFRYDDDYVGLNSYDLSPSGAIESNSSYTCSLYD